jgi:undecaprenyl-diphosphatase
MSSLSEVVHSNDVFGPDQAILDWMVDHRTDTWTAVMKVITAFGDTATLTVVALVGAIVLAGRRRWTLALLVGLGSLVAAGLMVGLKELIERPRPPLPERLVDLSTYSFPSGHAMSSTVIYGLVAVALLQCSRRVRAHPWVLSPLVLLVLAIGVSRVYLAAHWMTDVLAGWAFGAIYVAAATALVLRVPVVRPGSRAAPPTSEETPRSNRTDRHPGPPDRS